MENLKFLSIADLMALRGFIADGSEELNFGQIRTYTELIKRELDRRVYKIFGEMEV